MRHAALTQPFDPVHFVAARPRRVNRCSVARARGVGFVMRGPLRSAMAPVVEVVRGLAFLQHTEMTAAVASGDGIVAPEHVVGPLRCPTAMWLQTVRGAHVAVGDLVHPDIHGFRVQSDVGPAPDAAFGAAVLAGVSRSVTPDLDACTVDQQVPRTLWPPMRDAPAKE